MKNKFNREVVKDIREFLEAVAAQEPGVELSENAIIEADRLFQLIKAEKRGRKPGVKSHSDEQPRQAELEV